MYKALEDSIINRLKNKAGETPTAVLALVDIEPMPSDPSKMLMIGATGGIFVHFAGTNSADPEGIGGGTQEDSIEFDIYISTRNLRSSSDVSIDPGAYEIMEAARKALTGFFPDEAEKPIHMKKCGFNDHTDGIWQYVMTFGCRSYYTADEEPEPVFGTSKKIVFKNGDTETTIPEEN